LDQYYEGRVAERQLAKRRYEIDRCADCTLLWQRFTLSDPAMEELYERWISAEQSFEKQRARAATRNVLYARELEIVQGLVGRRPGETRVLDFGMGWGDWCAFAQGAGFDAVGVELSEIRRKHAEDIGVEAHDSLAGVPRGSVDFVNSEQVFEHLADPQSALIELRERLAPKGILRVCVPNARGMERKLARSNWCAEKDALHPLEHINAFTQKSLRRLGREAGLRALPYPRRAPRLPGLHNALREELVYRYQARFGTALYFVRDTSA